MKRFVIIFLIFLLPHISKAQEGSRSNAEIFKILDYWLDAGQAYNHIPSIEIGVIKDQTLLWSKGYGYANREEKISATNKSIYSICSITKVFTSIAIMQLRDQGKIRLDDSVSVYLPWFKINQLYPNSGAITIETLLTHSSGLPRESDFPYWTGPDYNFPTEKEIQDKLKVQSTLYPASTVFQYSNLGVALLGQIIEKVSGLSYQDYIETNILKPLKMNDSKLSMPMEYSKNLAVGYGAIKRDGSRDRLPAFHTEGMTSAAGLCTDLDDLAKFIEWQFSVIKGNSSKILKSSSLLEMYNVHWVDPDFKIYWGLGFIISQFNGKKYVGHEGECPGFHSLIIMQPDTKLGIIFLSNGGEVNPYKFVTPMVALLNQLNTQDTSNERSADKLEEYSGYYNAQPWGSERIVTHLNGNLIVLDLPADDPDAGMRKYKYLSKDRFVRIRDDGSLGEPLYFERNSDRQMTKMWSNSNYAVKLN